MKNLISILAIAITFCDCNSNPTVSDKEAKNNSDSIPAKDSLIVQVPLDTITTLKDFTGDSAFFKAPNGKVYKMIASIDSSMMEETSSDFAPANKSLAGLNCENDKFAGTHRKAAKTSIVTGSYRKFESLEEFLATLQDDEEMRIHPEISRDENNKRVAEEKRNVHLKNVYLAAIVRESDNDFHIIITDGKGTYFNIENSGLLSTSSANYTALKKARTQIEDFFGEYCSSKYWKMSPIIEIEVKGSLFYDIDHKPGIVGPNGLKPTTAWEIHPITDIKFYE